MTNEPVPAGRRVVVVGYDGAELLDIACLTTSFAIASASLGPAERPYAVTVAAPGGHPIRCGTGLVLQSEATLETLHGPVDTLIVSGGLGHEEATANPLLVGHVRRLARESRRVASVCTGASLLAAAGLLDGRRVTTHWRFAAQLAARHPRVTVDADPIFIRDGVISTAAGITSALDLALAFIEEDHGADLARLVSRDLVTYLQRPGNQAQMSVFTSAPAPRNDVVRRVTDHVSTHLADDLTTSVLAGVAGVTPRHLTRLFLDDLGEAPGRFVRAARVEAAAQLLSSTALPLPTVAGRCGFGSAETLRQAFTSRFGVPPAHYRTLHGRRPAALSGR